MTDQMEVSAGEAHERVASGKALLVCAYRDERVCRKVQLEGSISLREFEGRLPKLPRDQEIIFYCA
jgi:hypothetical protein